MEVRTSEYRITSSQIVPPRAKVSNGFREAIFWPIFTKFGTQVYYHTKITIGFDGMAFLYGLTILFSFCLRAAVVVKPGEPTYQDGVFQDGGYNVTKKFVYMADDWSPCSVTCGSGHQKRRVTCTRVTNKYAPIT